MLTKSLINCHNIGVDSLVVKGAPGMVRIFVARPEHNLWPNECHHDQPMLPLTVGMHSHHCDITMVPLFGEIHNVHEARASFPLPTRVLTPYAFQSAITTGEGKFVRVGEPKEVMVINSSLKEPDLLKAEYRHSMWVPKGEAAAWMIIEGKEDSRYKNITYSDSDLANFDFSELYKPMTPERLAEDLALLREHGINLG